MQIFHQNVQCVIGNEPFDDVNVIFILPCYCSVNETWMLWNESKTVKQKKRKKSVQLYVILLYVETIAFEAVATAYSIFIFWQVWYFPTEIQF